MILDDDLYHRARFSLMNMEVNPETLAIEVIDAVKPGGHFLSQKHTRKHMRTTMVRGVFHHLDSMGKYRDPVDYAREKVTWILENHHPEPPNPEVQKEIDRILVAADNDLRD
jgi:trimethylamine--corrinoid protein Co-methyltransferase